MGGTIKSVDLSPVNTEVQAVKDDTQILKGTDNYTKNFFARFRMGAIDTDIWTKTVNAAGDASLVDTAQLRRIKLNCPNNGDYATMTSAKKRYSKDDGAIEIKFRAEVTSSGGSVYFGLADSLTMSITKCIIFNLESGAASGNIKTWCIGNSGNTAADTGLDWNAGATNEFKIVLNDDWTSCEFYVDDVLKVTTTTNIPDANMLYLFFGNQRSADRATVSYIDEVRVDEV